MIWKPNVTVAAVVECDGRFLLVEEETANGLALNQPAGHLEEGESLLQAVTRETLEETGWGFTPQALLGIYRWRSPRGVTYLRFAFVGRLDAHDATRKLDTGIVRTLWLSPGEIEVQRARHRSPQVQHCVEDYLAGARYPLALLHDVGIIPMSRPRE